MKFSWRLLRGFGDPEELLQKANNKNISVIRELAHHLRWKASKLKPRNYGDRAQTELTCGDGGPVPFALAPMDWDGLIRRVTREPVAEVPGIEPRSPQETAAGVGEA